MTSQQSQVLVLRDGEGNFYLISGDAIQAGRVPDDKKAALEQGLRESQDVSGFLFDRSFEQNFSRLNQSNTASANNFMAGGLAVLSPQTITQVQGNIANVNQR